MKAAPQKQARSLLEFAIEKRREERRKACPVCRLPDEVRAQLKTASDKKIDVATRLAWLTTLGHQLSELDLKTHGSSAHDALNEQKAVAS